MGNSAEVERQIEEEVTAIRFLSRISGKLLAAKDHRGYDINKALHIIWALQKERPRG